MSALEDLINVELLKKFNGIRVGKRTLMDDDQEPFILYQAQKIVSKYVKTLIEKGFEESVAVDSAIIFYCEGVHAGYERGIIEMITENTIKKS